MKIKCLAIDDEPIALEKLSSYIKKVPYFELVAACSSPLDAVKVLSEGSVDVIFTDINMPDIIGTEFVTSLQNAPFVVFITAYPEYAVESYKIGAIDYILKPYSFADFQKTSERVRVYYEKFDLSQEDTSANSHEENSIFVKVDYKWMRINTMSIRYIQAYGDYLRLFLVNHDVPYLIHSSMTQIFKSLPPCFIQVHRSFIVNSHYIKEINKSEISLGGDAVVPIGNSYKENVNNFLSSRSIQSK